MVCLLKNDKNYAVAKLKKYLYGILIHKTVEHFFIKHNEKISPQTRKGATDAMKNFR